MNCCCFLNRQPTLWRHGIGYVDIIPEDNENLTIGLSPLVLEPYGADYDGDSCLVNMLVVSKIDSKLKFHRLHISEFNKYYNMELVSSKTKENGVIVKDYKILDDIYCYSIDIETSDIKLNKITNWSIHENLEMYSINRRKKINLISDIKNIWVSKDHSLIAFNIITNNIEKVTPGEIKTNPRNYLLIKYNKLRENSINNYDIVTELNNELTLKNSQNLSSGTLGYFFGVCLGDGSISKNRINLWSTEYTIGTIWSDILENIVDTNVLRDKQHADPSHESFQKTDSAKLKVRGYNTSNKKLVDFIISHFGKTSDNKCLPNWLLHAPDDFIIGLLAGYIDTDGTVAKKCIQMTSKSKELIEQFNFILKFKLNIQSSVYKEYKYYTVDNVGNKIKSDIPREFHILTINHTKNNIDNIYAKLLQYIKHPTKYNALDYIIKNTTAINKPVVKFIPSNIIDSVINSKSKTKDQIKLNQYTQLDIKIPQNILDTLHPILSKLLTMQNNNEIELIPCSLIDIELDPEQTTGYDVTVENYKTFTTDTGLFVNDTVSLYFIHDEDAIKEAYKNAHIKNVIYSDSNHEILYNIRHESLYAAFILSNNHDVIYENNVLQIITNLNDLVEEIDYYNNSLYSTVDFNGNLFTYGICLLNKWCGFNKIIINEVITKKTAKLISNKINEIHNEKFHDYLSELNKKLLMFISISNYCPTLNLQELIEVLDDNSADLFSKLPDNNVQLGYLINESLIDRCVNNFKDDSSLYKLFKSGSRFNKQQLARSCINIGYVADDNNIIVQKPVKTNLLKGQTEEDFFMGSPGSRKGISDKAVHVPESGYMERALTMALSILEIVEDDCNSQTYLITTIFDKKHCETLVGKYYKFNETDDLKVMDLQTAIQNIGNKIYLRSPMTCQTKKFKMCRTCFGDRKYPTSHVGIIAGQCLSERLTQLIMRSFHTSGSAILDIDNELVKFFTNNLIGIDRNNNNYILTFKNINIPESIKQINGFIEIQNNTAIFTHHIDVVKNKDTIQLMLKVKQLLKTQKFPTMHPFEFYEEMMKLIIEVETPYSSFIEMLFANMFICNPEKTEFWRYFQDKKPIRKFGDKNVVAYINKSLYTLFQPNQRTLKDLSNTININNDSDSSDLTIYEKICIGKILDHTTKEKLSNE